MSVVSRRAFLIGIPSGGLAASAPGGSVFLGPQRGGASAAGAPHPDFPAQDPKLVKSVVGFSHANIDGVRELIAGRPALAKASWDWGFGDWETALGAASHTGRRDIAELLIAHGARPNLFTFAMLDQVEAVRAILAANGGIERIHGPHGITLLQHARNGKAQRVLDYLEGAGGADTPYANEPLDERQKAAYPGVYVYGAGVDETLTVAEAGNGPLGLQRGEGVQRRLFHLGEHTFHPAGAPAVRINFRVAAGGAAETLTVHDGDLVVTARRAE
jgi:hypothetical protein